jgi:hypothetical protein
LKRWLCSMSSWTSGAFCERLDEIWLKIFLTTQCVYISYRGQQGLHRCTVNNLKVNTKVNKFCRRSTSLIVKDLKVNTNDKVVADCIAWLCRCSVGHGGVNGTAG